MAKPRKRKAYLEEAERCALKLFASYYLETGDDPSSTHLKTAMTKARNYANSAVFTEAQKRLNRPGDWHIRQHPGYNQTIKEIYKEINENVDDFWLRQLDS